MFKLVLEKAEEPEIKLPTSTGSLKKQESSRKRDMYFRFIDYNKAFKKIILLLLLLFLLYNILLVLPHINMNPPLVYTCSQSWTLLPHPSPYHPSGSSQCTSPKHPVSCIESRLAIHFLYDIYTCFNTILPNHPTLSLSHRVQKTVRYIWISFAVSHTGLSLPSF